jgi:hypothetical protein
MRGVEAAALHALQQQRVPAGIDDDDADGDARFLGTRRGRGHDLPGAGERQALGAGKVHDSGLLSPRRAAAAGEREAIVRGSPGRRNGRRPSDPTGPAGALRSHRG